MKLLRTTALAAALMTAAVPALTSPAHAWGWGWWYGYYPSYAAYGHSYPYCPAYRGRYAYYPYIHYYPYISRHMLRACCS
jgi:hypothetical protein